MDLGVWVHEGRIRPLLQLVEQLPGASRFRTAVLNDPEQAKIIAELPESDEVWRPQVHEWNLTAIQLQRIESAILGVYQSSELARTHKAPRRAEPLLGPETEVDRIRARTALAEVDDFLRRLVPHQFT